MHEDSYVRFHKYLDVEKASKATLIPPETLRQYCADGMVPHVADRVGNYYFNRAQIVDWANRYFFTEHGRTVSLPEKLTLIQIDPKGPLNGLPEPLFPMGGHLRQFNFMATIPCVYFLCKGGSVIYVGKTTNLIGRTTSHLQDKDFDTIYYLTCPSSDLNELEATFIRYIKPPLNFETTNGKTYSLEPRHLELLNKFDITGERNETAETRTTAETAN